jgi:uncharacterized protein
VIVYVDTSAAMKLVVEEAESPALAETLEACKRDASNTLVASLLLYTELHCAANRRPEKISAGAVADVLSTLALVDVESSDLRSAAHLPGRLRSADAIHLATALRVDARAIVLYDAELRTAAEGAGIQIISSQ